MKAQTKEDFASLLDDLQAAARDKEPADTLSAPSLRHDLLSQIERLRADNKAVLGRDIFDEYIDNGGNTLSAQAAPADDIDNPSLEPALADLFYLDPGTIARELNLRKLRTGAELDKARRNFAMRYHPDRMPEAERERAKLRMQIANMLIDEAKRAMR